MLVEFNFGLWEIWQRKGRLFGVLCVWVEEAKKVAHCPCVCSVYVFLMQLQASNAPGTLRQAATNQASVGLVAFQRPCVSDIALDVTWLTLRWLQVSPRKRVLKPQRISAPVGGLL